MSGYYNQLEELPFMLSAEKLSIVMGISKSNAYVLMNSEDFPSIRIGKRLLVNKDSLVTWIKEKESNK